MIKDINILISYVNTCLRDDKDIFFVSDSCGVSVEELEKTLRLSGYVYDEKSNKFVKGD